MTASTAEVCVVACAEAWRGDGAILASPMGVIPALGARLARQTFAPDLLMTDGEAFLIDAAGAQSFTLIRNGVTVLYAPGPPILSQIVNYDYFPASGFAYGLLPPTDVRIGNP